MPKLRVYIVEDEPLMAIALKRIIYTMGHNVCGMADCYETAVKDLRIVKADIVLTYIMIKGTKTGIDVAAFINRYLHIPFIFQSSVTCDDILKQAYDTCPNAFLQKPVSKAALLNALALLPALIL